MNTNMFFLILNILMMIMNLHFGTNLNMFAAGLNCFGALFHFINILRGEE